MTPAEQEALADAANALQVAAPLSNTLRRVVGDAAQHAIDLEAAIDRAVQALRRLASERQDREGTR